jgi:hypothetical protein
MEPLNLDTKTRELLVTMVMDFRTQYLRAEAYRALLQSAEQRPEILALWRTYAENMLNAPDRVVTERLDTKLQPVLDYALCGLPESDAQALLDRVRRMCDDIQ